MNAVNKISKFVTGLLAVLVLASLASFIRTASATPAMELGYRRLLAAPATKTYALQTGNYPAAVDSTTWATPSYPVSTFGNPKVAALCEMGTASATATVKCGLYFKDAAGDYIFLGETPAEALGATATATATAGGSTVTDGTGVYPANVIVFDTRGAPYYDIRITAISTGTTKVTKYAYGVASQ